MLKPSETISCGFGGGSRKQLGTFPSGSATTLLRRTSVLAPAASLMFAGAVARVPTEPTLPAIVELSIVVWAMFPAAIPPAPNPSVPVATLPVIVLLRILTPPSLLIPPTPSAPCAVLSLIVLSTITRPSPDARLKLWIPPAKLPVFRSIATRRNVSRPPFSTPPAETDGPPPSAIFTPLTSTTAADVAVSTVNPPPPCGRIVSFSAPGPRISNSPVRLGSCDARSITPSTPVASMTSANASPETALALRIAWRSEPGPASFVLATVNVAAEAPVAIDSAPIIARPAATIASPARVRSLSILASPIADRVRGGYRRPAATP